MAFRNGTDESQVELPELQDHNDQRELSCTHRDHGIVVLWEVDLVFHFFDLLEACSNVAFESICNSSHDIRTIDTQSLS